MLLVDDDDLIRRVCAQALAEEGCEVVTFAEGGSALAHLKNGGIDLVVTDLFMPDCDGMEVLLTLRKQHPTLKAVVISGGNPYWSGSLHAARQLGAVAVLPKPFELPEFVRVVKSVLAALPAAKA